MEREYAAGRDTRWRGALLNQYASDRHRQLLKDFHMTQSMSRVGNCWDNAAMESFFKTLKVERVVSVR